MSTPLRTAYILSAVVAMLALTASAAGLFVDGLYRDNLWVVTGWYGNDVVTLFIAVPLLIAALIGSRRGSQRWLLIWFAMLGYMIYNYAFYLFGAAFNTLFLVYVALLSLSLLALVFALPNVDVDGIRQQFRERTPVRGISIFMLLFSLMLGGMWIAQTIAFIATGQVPQVITDSAHPTSMVFALDLALLIPGMIVGAVLLWQRRAWGYVLSSMMVIKASTYALALIAMSVFAGSAGIVGAWDFAPLWAALGVGTLIASGFLLGNMRPNETPRSASPAMTSYPRKRSAS